ncbi:MAG: recombination protein RecR [Nitrospinae bacterium RIFCSPLOWO2_12_39_16]|nr:MAG: recombination protein RecR [Nitrospinae bacterium RIFCSPLOWO2_12_39_16]HBA26989.1 recombination protein RecR [Nitrospinota bacterium]
MKGPESLFKLIEELRKLPGVGRKTAERLAFYILKSQRHEADALVKAILELKEKVRLCSVCNSITEVDPCNICSDMNREKNLLCVVEEPHDVFAIEKTREFKGSYHVLMGVLSPLDGIGPSDLKIEELLSRVRENGIREVILATNPNLEGEATAMYIAKVLKPFGMKVTRIARGLPVGGDLEYADEVTLTKSIEGRQEM